MEISELPENRLLLAISVALRRLRIKAGISEDQLASSTGLDVDKIRKIENLKCIGSRTELGKIARAFDLELVEAELLVVEAYRMSLEEIKARIMEG